MVVVVLGPGSCPLHTSRGGMKYVAELLKNLDYISVYVEKESSHVLDLQQVTPSQLMVVGLGYVSQIIELPAELKDTGYKGSITANQLKLSPKVSPAVDLTSAPFKSTPDVPLCSCGSPLAQHVKWKQLPSEHWAELMDIWHCHKPSNKSEASSGIYELAMNGFHPIPGLAYFSETYFLVHSEDILASAHNQECAILARAKSETRLKLWKWDLDKNISISSVLFDVLRELVDSHAVFTFTINSRLILWVLNISSTFTFTGARCPLVGAKVLYGDASKLSRTRPDAEPIEIPVEAFGRLLYELNDVNEALPRKTRFLGEWKLGFLGTEAVRTPECIDDKPL